MSDFYWNYFYNVFKKKKKIEEDELMQCIVPGVTFMM